MLALSYAWEREEEADGKDLENQDLLGFITIFCIQPYIQLVMIRIVSIFYNNHYENKVPPDIVMLSSCAIGQWGLEDLEGTPLLSLPPSSSKSHFVSPRTGTFAIETAPHAARQDGIEGLHILFPMC